MEIESFELLNVLIFDTWVGLAGSENLYSFNHTFLIGRRVERRDSGGEERKIEENTRNDRDFR